MAHQEVAIELAVQLRLACPRDLRVIPEPAVQLSATTELDPDIVVIRREQVHAAKCTVPPLLVVKIRSPSTADRPRSSPGSGDQFVEVLGEHSAPGVPLVVPLGAPVVDSVGDSLGT
jgi:hypothetical protein